MARTGDLLDEPVTPPPGTGPGPDPSPPGAGGGARPARRRRNALIAGTVVAVVAVVVGLTATGSAPAPGGGSRSPSGSVRTADAAGSVATGATATLPVDPQPVPSADPSAPGTTVPSGEDQSDPFLLRSHGHYFLYTSGIPGHPPINVPVARTTDLRGTWSRVTDALPVLPHWAAAGFTWAPDVHQFGSTTVLYFTAGVVGTGQQCVGIATGHSPLGPFTAEAKPFICQTTLGGTIDPRVFTDASGATWMHFKSDQNIGGATTPTTMWSQRLSANGLHLTGRPSVLMGPDQPWQGTIVEAPDMVEGAGTYWLVYSGNWFNQPDYAIGAARCAGPSGPCADTATRPLLGTNAQGAGPGEASVYTDHTGSWMLYTPVLASKDNASRPVMITRIGFGPGGPYLAAGGPPSPLVRSGHPSSRSSSSSAGVGI